MKIQHPGTPDSSRLRSFMRWITKGRQLLLVARHKTKKKTTPPKKSTSNSHRNKRRPNYQWIVAGERVCKKWIMTTFQFATSRLRNLRAKTSKRLHHASLPFVLSLRSVGEDFRAHVWRRTVPMLTNTAQNFILLSYGRFFW